MTTESSTDVPVPAVLLDTSVVIDVEEVDRGEYADSAVVVSAVTVGELAYGLGAGDRTARELRLRRVLTAYEVVPFGVEEAKLYGVLAELVRIAGRSPRPRRLDLQIAATAAAARIPLLTMNPDDFIGVAPLVDVVPIRRAG
ncbi:PIN domain-containing protein [Pseudonocardia charpentierae]|uniref:PIN domain-containing protein n=1 Tax=Pseudonocardia charpentierae TaxID=3075545 RepID=UPI00288A883D|nr:PIN domain-containing protein [Pseudonocardia sp. DSM 45834]